MATPMMAQWRECKERAGDALVFFRLGDFYEAFHEDAAVVARELQLTLTERQGVPMCGVPWHTSEGYVDRLVSRGFHVAIAEQMEDPSAAKGLVRREIVRTVTPGTNLSSALLADKTHNFFACVAKEKATYGVALIDVSTADFIAFELEDEKAVLNQLSQFQPRELLTSAQLFEREKSLFSSITIALDCRIQKEEAWKFDRTNATYALQQHLRVSHLDGFGLKNFTSGITAAGALLRHVRDLLNNSLEHITTLSVHSVASCMAIDHATMSNLELVQPLHDGKPCYTLLHTIDATKTPMGGRLLRSWLQAPLVDCEKIAQRHDAVAALIAACNTNLQLVMQVDAALAKTYDIERLIAKVSTNFAGPRDILALARSLEMVPTIQQGLGEVASPLLQDLVASLHAFPELTDRIRRAIVDNPPLRASDGAVFRQGYSAELDAVLQIKTQSQEWLAAYQTRLREETGIKTIKVGFTRMFGYYIEVSKGQTSRMPDTFSRRQTLVNAERYISPELKEFEEKIFTADERIAALEMTLYTELVAFIRTFEQKILATARALAAIDVLRAFAEVAIKQKYTRPIVDNSHNLELVASRHPVVEKIRNDDKFTPNDCIINATSSFIVITGPNMAGKSTYIRQVALAVILAQVGSFVPAEKAHIGIITQLFSRIGASDDLARGQSTFMVEMCETAYICNTANERSLVILDEIGRGTSTYDGIAIAWAVAEFLIKKNAKTLFATHYYEITELETQFPQVKNATVAVSETAQGIQFLHTIIPGKTDKSWGIHVAQLAGLPKPIITRAEKLLTQLKESPQPQKPQPRPHEPDLFTHAILRELSTFDTLNSSPLQALTAITNWQKSLESA